MERFPNVMLVLASLFACRSPPPTPMPTPARVEPSPANESAEWWHDVVFYEIFVRSFADSNGDGIGDFAGLTAKLDYLRELGVNGVWLMPVHPSPSYHGYDVTDYRGVHPDYGDLASFRRFLSAARAAGVRVIIDFVLNHSSSEHPWFKDARTGPSSAHRNFYLWRDAIPKGWGRPWDGGAVWHPANGSFYYGLFWSGMPDLNLREPAVEKEMVEAMKYWLSLGVDGFRVDAVRHLAESESGVLVDLPETHAISKKIRSEISSAYPEALLVAEAWTSLEDVAAYYGDGDEYQLAFGFDAAAAIKTSVNDGTRADLNQLFARQKAAYRRRDYEAPFLSNHDMKRVMRSFGGDADKARLAAAVLLALPGTPFLYYGEEIGMQGGADPRDEDKRTFFPWTENAPEKRWHAVQELPGVSVEAQRADPRSLWSAYQRLIALRRSSPALSRGEISSPILKGGGRGVIALLRENASERILFLANLDGAPSPAIEIDVRGSPVLLEAHGIRELPNALRFDALPPKSFAFIRL